MKRTDSRARVGQGWTLIRRLAGLVTISATMACTSADERTAALMVQLGGGQSADPMPIPSGVLTDQEGRPFDLSLEAPGYVTLVFFGYTFCPDVCPLHMSAIASGLHQLTPEQRDRVRVVFLSADPTRDTADRLKAWLGSFDPQFIGLTGSTEDIDGMLAQLGFPPIRFEETDNPDVYFVYHPAVVLGYTPDGVGRLVYFSGMTADRWAHDLDLLTAHPW